MTMIRTIPSTDIPLPLLLHADPSKERIETYLAESWCFGAFDEHSLSGACVTNTNETGVTEIYNLVVLPEKQQQGIGTTLLRWVIHHFADKGETCLELGTGTFGYQLRFYQRLGFRVESVWKDYFLNNCPEPIYEHGVQHKDMLRLRLQI